MSFAPDLQVESESDTDAASEPTAAELQAQLIAAEERAARAEEDRLREQRRIDDLLRGRSEPDPQRREPLGAMPDPAEDPKAAEQWILESQRRQVEETEARISKHAEQVNARIESETQAARLWDAFSNQFPAYAQRRELAQQAFQSLTGSGSLPAAESKVPAAVKAEMDRIVGAPLDSLSKPADRTAGTSAGVTPASPKPKAAAPEDETVTIHSAASKRKRELGLI